MTVAFSHGWKILPHPNPGSPECWDDPMETAEADCPGDECFGCKSDAITKAHREWLNSPCPGFTFKKE